jgi:hypothetical protein
MHQEIVKLLLDKGADVNTQDNLVSRVHLHDCGIEYVATVSPSGLKVVASNPRLSPVAQNWGVAQNWVQWQK